MLWVVDRTVRAPKPLILQSSIDGQLKRSVDFGIVI